MDDWENRERYQHQIVIYPDDSVIHPFSSWGQMNLSGIGVSE